MMSRKTRSRWQILSAVGLLCAVCLACAKDRPLVERMEQGAWQADTFQIKSMGGQYASAQVTFILRLADPAGRELTVEGAFDINPRPILTGGSWQETGGPAPRNGRLSSAQVDFFGGQGERPALGGRLTLSSDGADVYRIHLPKTQLSRER